MKVVTQNDIKNINELYFKLKTYAAVARETGFAPSTIKKYVIPDYKPVEMRNIQVFDKELPEFTTEPFRCNNWNYLCVLSDKEKEDMKVLWEEIDA